MFTNSTNTEAKERIKIDLESLKISNFFNAGFTKFKNGPILLNKISR